MSTTISESAALAERWVKTVHADRAVRPHASTLAYALAGYVQDDGTISAEGLIPRRITEITGLGIASIGSAISNLVGAGYLAPAEAGSRSYVIAGI